MSKNLFPILLALCANCPFDKEYQYCWKECQEKFRNLPLDEQIDKINEMAKNFGGSK